MFIEECRLCGKPVSDEVSAIGFAPLGGMEMHLLYGAVVHKACLNGWDQRDDFIDYWNGMLRKNPQYRGRCLGVNEFGEVEYVGR